MSLKKLLVSILILFVGLFILFVFSPMGEDRLGINKLEKIETPSEIILQSTDGKYVGIYEIPIKLSDQSNIKVKFQVKSEEEVKSPIPLLVDLFDDKFDLPKHDRLVSASNFFKKSSSESFLFELNRQSPKEFRLRLYTLSTVPISIKNLEVYKGAIPNKKEFLKDLWTVFLFYILFVYFLYMRNRQLKPIITYLVSFFALWFYCMVNSNMPFYHDSLGYWNYGKLFEKDNLFQLTNYDNALRGYLFPLVNYALSKVAVFFNFNEIGLFRFFSSIFYTFTIIKLIPDFFEFLLKKQISLKMRFIFLMVFFIFWRGYVLYPLTDFFSLAALISAILIVNNLNFNSDRWFQLVTTGMLIFTSFNLRPSYVIIIVPFIIYLLYQFLNIHKFKISFKNSFYFIRNMILIGIGICLLSVPQVLINKVNFQINSIFVPMEKFFNGQNLMLSKLKLGMTIQKYETYVGSEYDSSVALLNDTLGLDIINKNGIKEFNSYAEYITLVFQNMFSFSKIYLKHLFNGFDIRYSTPYIVKFHSIIESHIIQFINFTILFLCLYLIRNHLNKIFSRSNIEKYLAIIILLLPCLVSLPTEPEVRFYIPLVLMTSSSLFLVDFEKLFYKKNIFIYLLFIIFMFITSYQLNKNLYFL